MYRYFTTAMQDLEYTRYTRYTRGVLNKKLAELAVADKSCRDGAC